MHPSSSEQTNPIARLTSGDAQELTQLVTILWGNTERGHQEGSSFSRWSTSFIFSSDEPTALVCNKTLSPMNFIIN
jgi:hypothetical protein